MLNDRLTILIPTNLIKSAPNIDIISETINDLKQHDLDGVDIIVGMDCNGEGTDRFDEYINNIKEKYPSIKLVISNGTGIYNNFTHLFSACSTEYCFLLEHDWVFNKPIEFDSLISVMDTHPHINNVRFNLRPNIVAGTDHTLYKDDQIKEMNLLNTSSWSNNPKIMRMSHWDYCNNRLTSQSQYNYNTIESALFYMFCDDVKNTSFEDANKNIWGSYIYGELNDEPTIQHLDGRMYG